MSIEFPPVLLGPEMAAPILWAPGIFWFFLLENPHAQKCPPFRGVCWVFLEEGGGSANFNFMGVGIFPINKKMHTVVFIHIGHIRKDPKFQGSAR